VLLVDTDRVARTIDERIYGQFLEEINHSVVDGLYAEQVPRQGFEGKDFADYWTPFGTTSRTYDWRAGLHAAGSLLSYEKLSPALALSSPALLMRNTTDDPEWRSWIYHDHGSWFAGSRYVAQKLFRDYYAPRRHAFTSGTFKDIPRRAEFFGAISQIRPRTGSRTPWTRSPPAPPTAADSSSRP
jgi:hypothetical protein